MGTALEQAEHTLLKAARYRDESKSALQEAAELQQEAIDLLLIERAAIDARLLQLGHGDGQIKKRRGRPPLPKGLSPAEDVIDPE
jgi:hypothetical protein